MTSNRRRDRVWVLPMRAAKELAALVGCELRTIQHAALGKRCNGDKGERAMTVVADYFDLNPTLRPAGWKRPAHAPLRHQVAASIAVHAGVDVDTVQRIAGGIPRYDDTGTLIVSMLHDHYAQHPDDAPLASAQEAQA